MATITHDQRAKLPISDIHIETIDSEKPSPTRCPRQTQFLKTPHNHIVKHQHTLVHQHTPTHSSVGFQSRSFSGWHWPRVLKRCASPPPIDTAISYPPTPWMSPSPTLSAWKGLCVSRGCVSGGFLCFSFSRWVGSVKIRGVVSCRAVRILNHVGVQKFIFVWYIRWFFYILWSVEYERFHSYKIGFFLEK